MNGIKAFSWYDYNSKGFRYKWYGYIILMIHRYHLYRKPYCFHIVFN